MVGFRKRAAISMWQSRGFSFGVEQLEELEAFIDEWNAIYNRPGLTIYRSQEALFASQCCYEMLSEVQPIGRHNRARISALRMGYAVAVTESIRADRTVPDENIRALFEAMSTNEHWPSDRGLERAMAAGTSSGRLAVELVTERVEILDSVVGFRFREAVFADIKATAFVKHQIATAPRGFDSNLGLLLVKAGHAVGWLEEALPSKSEPFHDLDTAIRGV